MKYIIFAWHIIQQVWQYIIQDHLQIQPNIQCGFLKTSTIKILYIKHNDDNALRPIQIINMFPQYQNDHLQTLDGELYTFNGESLTHRSAHNLVVINSHSAPHLAVQNNGTLLIINLYILSPKNIKYINYP